VARLSALAVAVEQPGALVTSEPGLPSQ
jgi:hypothetical protein